MADVNWDIFIGINTSVVIGVDVTLKDTGVVDMNMPGFTVEPIGGAIGEVVTPPPQDIIEGEFVRSCRMFLT